MLDWLEKQKGKVEKTTYIGYEQVIKGRLYKYFKAKKIKKMVVLVCMIFMPTIQIFQKLKK